MNVRMLPRIMLLLLMAMPIHSAVSDREPDLLAGLRMRGNDPILCVFRPMPANEERGIHAVPTHLIRE